VTEFAFHAIDRAFPSFRKPLTLVMVMGVAFCLELSASAMLHFSSPELFLLPALALVGIISGLSYAFVAAAMSILFVAVVSSNHATILHQPWDPLVRLILFSLAAAMVALTVGLQHRHIEEISSGRVNQALRTRAADLAELAAALKLSNDELDQFTYVTSHDLKAPLRGINNLSQWIEEDLGDAIPPQTREQLNLLRGRVQRMESLINGLLEYAHVGRTQGNIERVDMDALLKEVIDWIGPPPEVQVRMLGPMPTFDTDRIRLQQVLTNLIENAVKHRGRPCGLIDVRCETVGRFFRISVADNGQGIEPQYQQRIFGIFQTLLPRDSMEGTGIGLALVKKIVELKGGSVWLESIPGSGATFGFTWPREGSTV
jgi:signal transduction histidine kinase